MLFIRSRPSGPTDIISHMSAIVIAVITALPLTMLLWAYTLM